MCGIIFKFKRLIIFTLIILILSVSFVSASDVNETQDKNEISIDDTAVLTVGEQNILCTFDELNKDVQNLTSGDVYNIDKDYYQDDRNSTVENNPCITIAADNITVNGNGHILDGKNQAITFKIIGNNVKINNLTICNCKGYGETIEITISENPITTKYVTDRSPIYWIGDNGKISNCIFSGNSAVNGGAITWTGNNGIINNNIFINNSAEGAGGALYIAGRNNKINNVSFINSTSRLINESVYLDRKHESFNFSNIHCDNTFSINGTVTDLDVENLHKVYYSRIMSKEINIIPMIYSSLFGVNVLDNTTFYYGRFSKENHTFTLSVVKNFNKDHITCEQEYIIQTEDLNNIFAGLMSNLYKVNLKFIKNLDINDNITEYNEALHHDKNYYFNIPAMDIVNNDMDNILNLNTLNYILIVNFEKNSYFKSNEHWNEQNGFDIIIINGNGATIHAESHARDENKWIKNNGITFIISNLTIEGFNTAVENSAGVCIFKYVTFNNNKMFYIRDRDDGAGIYNSGIVICISGTFTNNYAKNGGAILNEKTLILENCSFLNNTGYGKGNDVLNVDQGVVIMNGQIVSGSEGPILYAKTTTSKAWLWLIGAGVCFICFPICYAMSYGIIVGVISICGNIGAVSTMVSAYSLSITMGVGMGVGAAYLGHEVTGADLDALLVLFVPQGVTSLIGAILTGWLFPILDDSN